MSDDTNEHLRRGLVDGLVGRHRRLYLTSATFKAGIDAMAQLVPAWVDGMAANAMAEDVDRQERIKMASRRYSPAMFLTKEDAERMRLTVQPVTTPKED